MLFCLPLLHAITTHNTLPHYSLSFSLQIRLIYNIYIRVFTVNYNYAIDINKMSPEREFNLKYYGVKFKYLSQLVKNLLDKQDRKGSIKLPHLFLCKTCS